MASTQTSSHKRKTRPPESVSSDAHSEGTTRSPVAAPDLPRGEYETGRVTCEECGEAVSFRDESTGGFTVSLWEAHRMECHASSPQQIPPPFRQVQSIRFEMAEPNAKRRRAKRSEEERIEYLRSDPYVAQFEAYRVLCKCCDKWIRLRPNSTYCSIPWDAHRRSCVSKRVAKGAYPANDRSVVFSTDPAISDFDAERVLCKLCDSWITVGDAENTEAVRTWMDHRRACQQGTSPAPSASFIAPAIPSADSVPPPSRHLLALASSSSLPAPAPPLLMNGAGTAPTGNTPVETYASSSRDVAIPTAPASEPKRKNADQRAAILRADPLVGDVEPNRIFCTLCKKWVQLRQDSAYCSYPWQQHRGKCVKRMERRALKEEELQSRRAAALAAGLEMPQEDADESDDPESEEGVEDRDESRKNGRREEKRKAPCDMMSFPTRRWRPDIHVDASRRQGGRSSASDVSEQNEDAMDVDTDVVRASRLANLDTPHGRLDFTYRSVRYLFKTTYERTDELTIAALVTYLNAAMPPDKHEDFDTAEVTKAAMTLHERGYCAFEGDVLRMPN